METDPVYLYRTGKLILYFRMQNIRDSLNKNHMTGGKYHGIFNTEHRNKNAA